MEKEKKIEEAIKEIEKNETLSNDTKVLILSVLKDHLFLVRRENAEIQNNISFYENGFKK